MGRSKIELVLNNFVSRQIHSILTIFSKYSLEHTSPDMETIDILLAIDERGSIPSRKCNFDFFRSKTAHRQDWIEFVDECETR